MQLRVEHDRVSVVWNIVKPYNNGERNGQRNYEISLRNIRLSSRSIDMEMIERASNRD